MLINYLTFILLFCICESILNVTVFAYLKRYFKVDDTDSPKFFWFNISTFKGMFERFVLYTSLTLGITQILIVFGAIKIGTRFEKNDKIKNDYFLIGNFLTIIISILYCYYYKKIITWV